MCKRNTMGSALGELSPLLFTAGDCGGAAHAAKKRPALAAAPRKKVRRETTGRWE
jgi:hypothetical protein